MAPIETMSTGISSIVKRIYQPKDREYDCTVIEVVMMSIATLLVINRLHVRFYVGQVPGLDDWTIVASLFFCHAMHIVNILAIYHGYGLPTDQVPKYSMDTAMKLFFCLQIFYKCTITLTKVSIVLLYRRIFDTSRFAFQHLCNWIIGFVAAYGISSILVTLAECFPIERVWDRSIPGTCINFTAFWYANAVWNISTDIVILILPMPMIHTLGLPTRSKLALMAVFTLGIFVCITSVLRIKTLDTSSKSLDQSYGTFLSTMWSTIEATTAVICACLPMLRIPISRILPRLLPLSRRGRSVSHEETEVAGQRENRGNVLIKLVKLAKDGSWLKRK